MDALRKTPVEQTNQLIGSLESDSISIKLEKEGELIKPKIDFEYPWRESKRYSGELKYDPDPLISGQSTNKKTFDITYRTGSELLLIHNLGSAREVRDVVSETVRSVDNISLLKIPYKRKSVWSFVFSGEYQPEIIIRDYENDELIPFEDMADLSQEEIAENHRLQEATIVFNYNGDSVHVVYRDDELSFIDASPEQREYVLQLYEKYIIAGEVAERFE
jgi:hypothetical protein